MEDKRVRYSDEELQEFKEIILEKLARAKENLATLTEAFAQKSIYTPKDLRQMNLLADTSMWSYTRMECTENFAIMWQKGFGYDLSCPPKLEGQPMRVDLDNLKEILESYTSD